MMASDSILPSEDNARFLHCTWLLKKVGRKVLLEHVPITEFHTRLKHPKTRSKIKDNKNVSPDQYAKLYPSTGPPPDPYTFDVTLLALVLRVVFGWADPPLPLDPNNLTKFADMYRLRRFRNENAHSSEMAFSETAFQSKWEELKQVLLRLGSTISDLENQIDKLKEKPLNPEREEKLKDAIEKWKELAQLPPGLKSLMTSSKDFLEDCVEDDVYIKTSAYQNAKKVLENANFLVISGLPGEGKTTMAQKLAIELSSAPERCIVIDRDTPEDWEKVDTEYVPIEYLIIDDIFGAGALDQRLAKKWEPWLRKIERRMKKAKFKTIITTRHYILEEAQLVRKYESLFKKRMIVHISSKDLSTEERRGILSVHLRRNQRSVQESLIQECIGISNSFFARLAHDNPNQFTFGFPQCVDMFVRNSDLFDKGSHFFNNPKQFFMDVLKDLKRDEIKEKFLALILMWARGGKPICKAEMSYSTLSEDLQKIANNFGFSLESYYTFTEVKDFLKHHIDDLFDYQSKTGAYTFSHNVIGDMVGLVLCEDYQEQTLKYSSRDFIIEYVTTDKKKNNSDYFYVEDHEYTYLIKRLAELMLRDVTPVRTSSVRHLKKFGRCPNKLVPSDQIDTAFTDKSFFRSKRFIKSFVKYVKDHFNEVLHTPVMTMSGYFLGTGITNKDIEIYLPEYFLLKDNLKDNLRDNRYNTLLIDELIDQKVPWGISGDKQLEISLTVAVHVEAFKTAEMLLMAGAVATQETVYIAAVHEHTVLISLLMQNNDSIKSSAIFHIVEGNSPLIISAKKGLMKSVECLIKNGADITYRNTGGFCALDKAVLFKHADVCKLLLNAGSPVNERQRKFNRTPLHVASDIGSVEIVKLLLENGASDSLHVKDHRRQCPIHCAAFRGHTGVVEALLRHDASLATQRAISYGKKSVIRGMSVYHIAVWKKNPGLIQMLVDGGVKPDTKDCFGRTPLYCAVFDDKEDIVKLLLPHSDPNTADKKGHTPLYCAALNGRKHLVELLLEHADPNLTDKQGRTPLCAAMINKKMDVANLLCTHADVNKADKEGVTVLHEACNRGNIPFAVALIECHRADYMCRDKKGRTAYDVATSEVKRAIDDKYIELSRCLHLKEN